MSLMDIISKIHQFNEDKNVANLRSLYEYNSFLNSLSISRREMSHSSFLADLLREDSYHELGTLPLQLFLEAVLHRAIKQNTRMIEDQAKEVMFPTLKSGITSRSLSISDIDITTEESFEDKDGNNGRVDLLVTCRVRPLSREKGKDVEFLNIIIENKIYAKEQDQQTGKYYKHFNAFLKNKAAEKVDVSTRKVGPRALYNLYVYLTAADPNDVDKLKEPESECKECVQICYQDILDYVIEPLMEEPKLSSRGRFYLEEYRRALGVSFEKIETPEIKTKRENIIMAVSKKELKAVNQFWADHRDLIVPSINEKNRTDDEEDETASGKRTLYDYKGQPYNMSRLVEAVILDHAADYDLDEMNQFFSGIVGKILCRDAQNKAYFEAVKEVQTKDYCDIKVFKQWTESGQYKFEDFCKKMKELGWGEVKEFQKETFSKEESLMLVDFYEKNKKLINTAMEVIRHSDNAVVKAEVESLLRRTGSHRDRTTYTVTLSDNRTLRNLSWGRLVLSVLQDYTSQNSLSREELISTFSLPKSSIRKVTTNNAGGNTGFFTQDSELLSLSDEKYMIVKGWTNESLKKFINASEELLYNIRIDKKN